VRLDARACADLDATLDLNEWTNESVVADCASIKVYWRHDGYSLPKHDIFNTTLYYMWLSHGADQVYSAAA
jgi:hypothetical protein